MDTKANIKEFICTAHKASFEAYNFPDPNAVTQSQFYDWAQSDSNVDTFDCCLWPFMVDGGGEHYFSSQQKDNLLNYYQTIADANNIPFYASLAIQEYDSRQKQAMVLALCTTLKDRAIDIKADYITYLRSIS